MRKGITRSQSIFCHRFLGYQCISRISWFLCNDSKSVGDKCHLQQECDQCPKPPHRVIVLFFQPQNLPMQELCLRSLRRNKHNKQTVISDALTGPSISKQKIKLASIIRAFPLNFPSTKSQFPLPCTNILHTGDDLLATNPYSNLLTSLSYFIFK